MNGHRLYLSLITCMLNKLLNFKEKEKYNYVPCLYPVQASQFRFILIKINIHVGN